jgi:aspartyl-tRNA(Asn)/glutamyl-tRNA(Gln) amidotransferase subunit B
VLTGSRAIADYFEATLALHTDAKAVANWVMGDILRIVNDTKTGFSYLRITPKRLAVVLAEIAGGAISPKDGKKVIDLVVKEDKEPRTVIAENGMAQVSDRSILETAVKQVIAANPKEVERFKAGEPKLVGFFVGQAIKLTGGKGNPKEISGLVMKFLG